MPHGRNGAPIVALAVAIGVVFAAAGSAAQPPSERKRIVSVNLGMQVINDAFKNRVTFQQYGETGAFDAHYDFTGHVSFDGDLAVRPWKEFAVGVAVSHVAMQTNVRIDAEVPNQYFAEYPHLVSGVRGGLDRREIGLHLQGQFWRRIGETFLVRGTLGPTIFMVRQDLVSRIGTRESAVDYEKVLLESHQATTVTAGAVGFNLGFDGTWFVTRRLGLGLTLRYSRGTATVRLGRRSPTPLELGGTHAGAGLRLAF